MAPMDCAYYLAVLQSTSLLGSNEGSSSRSVLLPTTARSTSFEELLSTSSAHSFMHLKERSSATSQTNIATLASLQQIFAIALYFSCPAVSQICNRYVLPGGCQNTFSMKLAPRVAGERELYQLLTNLWLMLVLPTPDTPTTTIFILGVSIMRLAPPTELSDYLPLYSIGDYIINPNTHYYIIRDGLNKWIFDKHKNNLFKSRSKYSNFSNLWEIINDQVQLFYSNYLLIYRRFHLLPIIILPFS